MPPTDTQTAPEFVPPVPGSTLFQRRAALRARYSVATEQTTVCRNGHGEHSRTVTNPAGTWHALNPDTGRLVCAFDGAVYRWDRYDFQASTHATRCLDCTKILEETFDDDRNSMNAVEFVTADIFGTGVVAQISPHELGSKLADFVSKVLDGLGDFGAPQASTMEVGEVTIALALNPDMNLRIVAAGTTASIHVRLTPKY